MTMNVSKFPFTLADDFHTTPESDKGLTYSPPVMTAEQHQEKLGLQPISIRLQKDLIENLKMIATTNGIGYQTLIKQILNRFVRSELRMLEQQKAKEMRMQAIEEELNKLSALRDALEQERNAIRKTA